MFRFIMPDPQLGIRGQTEKLLLQFRHFLDSEQLKEIYELLKVDQESFRHVYNGRKAFDGRIIETQAMKPLESLEEVRYDLYPLLDELGFFGINQPVMPGKNRMLILAGSLSACYRRVRCVYDCFREDALTIDGLTCFRPINPIERKNSPLFSGCDTEFGAMSDAFAEIFKLSLTDIEDYFQSDRNLNSV
ncbi:MAG: hypothetical protein IJH64_08615 [Oscillospiraceae bacterium]|nr:hypothetical protein [Oscillospiraceae bacterium]